MLQGARPRRVVARAPVRLDLGGGWTDVPPYCDTEGGFVCNVTIDRYATATATAGNMDSGRRNTPASGGGGAAVAAAPAPPATADSALITAVLRNAGVPDLRLTLHSDFPVGAGLGGSSAASAALLGTAAVWRGEPWNRRAIAEEGRRIELEEMGIPGGRQDHYAATQGGALALTFTESVEIRRIPFSTEARAAFERRAILVHTGQSRVSGETITAVLDAFRAKERRVLTALARMKSLARQIAGAVEDGDVDGIGTLMGEHWLHQRSLHPAIPTPRIDEIVRAAAASGASGAKAMGASGGGCVLVVARDDTVAAVRAAVEPLGTVLPFKLDLDGLTRCE
jgi:D-glycero-alpha-D-manno-heptose-7-phosphate kinase